MGRREPCRRGLLAMTARRITARDLLTPEQLAQVRTRSTWKGLGMVVHAWALIAAAITLAAAFPNPLTYLVAVAVIGARQLGLAILMHEGAHGGLAVNQKLNLFVSQWFCAFAVFAETESYRRYHFKHHAHTGQRDDPDLLLSKHFPITRKSLRRKLLRDVTGQTGFEQRKAQFANALGSPDWPWTKRITHLRRKLGGALAANAILFAVLTLCGVWWAYPLLWLVPLLTWHMVILRLRNIAEHAVVDPDDPFRNARTTIANPLERLFLAPYFVNYHLEHHLLYYVPCYNLPALHRMLRAGPYGARMEVRQGYAAVLTLAASRPDDEDKPGEIIHNARRRAADLKADEDAATAL